MHVLHDTKIVLVGMNIDAGIGEADSDAVNCAGFGGVTFVVVMGTMDPTATCQIGAQMSQDNGNVDSFTSIAGSKLNLVDTQGDKVFLIDVREPLEKWVRAHWSILHANAQIQCVLAILHSPRSSPTDVDVSVGARVSVASAPAE